ncbi:MAG: ferredoxin family 2Fe-2S iron-sulfur cluster binding protein [Rhodospirillaceae bacterium]
MLKMTFIDPDGTRHEVEAPEGLSVLEVAHRHGFDLEGACEGSMACSTCHVIVDPEWFDKLPATTEEEEDMLDLAFDVRPTSRLGCQIAMVPALDGLVVSLPSQHYNLMGG